MKLMYITNDVDIAQFAESCGVNRIFIDMEFIGKDVRQGHLDTHKAQHSASDVKKIANVLKTAEVLARVNPIYDDSNREIQEVIQAGANVIMLPMFTTSSEVEKFVRMVNGQAAISLLLETPQSLTRLDDILEMSDHIDEIHIGLNDLHLGMGLDFMFELLSGGIVDFAVDKIKKKNIRFGIGGIACVGQGMVPAELILGEHVRLGSEMVILSRTFHSKAKSLEELKLNIDLDKEIKLLLNTYNNWKGSSLIDVENNKLLFRKVVNDFVQHKQELKVKSYIHD